MPVAIRTCRHYKTNGLWCGSPALRGHQFCFFHHQWRENHPNRRRAGETAPLEIPLLEDANAIQVALQRVVQAIVAGQIDNKAAGLLLYAFQTASFNLKHTNFEPYDLRESARRTAQADAEESLDMDCEVCVPPDLGDSETEEEDSETEVADEAETVEADVEEELDEVETVEAEGDQPLSDAQSPVADCPSPPTRKPPATATRPLLANDQRLTTNDQSSSEMSDKEFLKLVRQLARTMSG